MSSLVCRQILSLAHESFSSFCRQRLQTIIVVMVAESVPMAQFAEYTDFPLGNAEVVAVVVIPVLTPVMGKNHIVFMEIF